MTRLKILLILCICMASCTHYKKTSISNEVFLSHRLFKKNYQKYVYLVHDHDSTYLLHNTQIEQQPQSDSVIKISGIIKRIPTRIDTSNYQESYRYLVANENHIDIFLTKDSSRKVQLNQPLDLVESDIQKVHMDRYQNENGDGKLYSFMRNFLLTLILVASSIGFIALIVVIGSL